MSSSHSNTVRNTHCYVYDPTSHEECDIEDSSRMDQHNKAGRDNRTRTPSSKSDQQGSSGSRTNDRTGRSSDSGTRPADKADKTNLTSGLKDGRGARGRDSFLSRDRFSLRRSKAERNESRLQISGDRTGKGDNKSGDLIVLSDDSNSSPKRRSSDRGQKRTRTRSRSPHKTVIRDERNRNRSRSPNRKNQSRSKSPHKIVIRDQRYKRTSPITRRAERSSSKGRRSGSQGRRSGSRGRHRSRSRNRSRSRSGGRRRRDGGRKSVSPALDRGREMRAGEMDHIKERIEKLKMEIRQTKMQSDKYLERDDRLHDIRDAYVPPTSPKPPPYYRPPPHRLLLESDGRQVDRPPPHRLLPEFDGRQVDRPPPHRMLLESDGRQVDRPPPHRLLPESDGRQVDDRFGSDADMVPPQQRVGYSDSAAVDVSRDRSRDNRSADNLRREMPAETKRQLTPPEPRTR